MIKILGKFGSVISVGVFGLLHPFAAVAQPTQSSPYWYGPGPWHMMWGFGLIFPLFVLLLIVVCVLFVMRGPWGHSHRSSADATSSALQILNERFAKDEIKKEEYEEKKAAILR
jgi:putative membrane protein